jgi:hypothetical protein
MAVPAVAFGIKGRPSSYCGACRMMAIFGIEGMVLDVRGEQALPFR